MLGWQGNGYWVPFPRIPKGIRTKYSIRDLFLRAFGFFEEDLNIDFTQKASPHLVTQILQCSTRDKNGEVPNRAFFWDLTIGKRIECLLAIATFNPGNSSKLDVRLRCSSGTCQQQMEMDISLAELTSLQLQADDTDHRLIQIGGENVRIRKPTGSDQLEWLKNSFASEDEAAKAMVRSLIVDTKKTASHKDLPITDDQTETINQAMEEFDPLVNFSLLVNCPDCGKEGRYQLNLEALSLRELHKAKLNLLQAIHRLAAHYHWSELQILSIPPWRRSHYLALIEREETR